MVPRPLAMRRPLSARGAWRRQALGEQRDRRVEAGDALLERLELSAQRARVLDHLGQERDRARDVLERAREAADERDREAEDAHQAAAGAASRSVEPARSASARL